MTRDHGPVHKIVLGSYANGEMHHIENGHLHPNTKPQPVSASKQRRSKTMSKLLPLITATTLALGVSISPAPRKKFRIGQRPKSAMSNLTTTSRCGGWCCATQSQRASYFSCTAFPRRSTHGTPLPLSLLITLKSIRSIGRIWPVLTAIDGQIFLCAPRLCARAEGIYRRGRPRSIDTHHIRDRYWGSPGALGGN